MAHEGRTCAQDLGVAAATAAITYIRDMREGERKGSWISANHRHVPEPFESLEAWRPWCVSIHALHQTTDWEILMKRPWPGTAKTRCIIGLATGLRTETSINIMLKVKITKAISASPSKTVSAL
jgi:hypothetical protein